MNKIILTFVLLVAITTTAQKSIFTSAKIKSATVYFNSAELSQTASATLPVGTSEIVIKNVADYLNENTVQIGVPSHVTVLSVQFTKNYFSEYEIDENSPEIKKVKDSIELVKKELGKIIVEKTSHQKTIELLDKNQQVAGNNGLSVVELMKLVDYYNAKRTELNNNLNSIYEREVKWNTILAGLNAKLQVNNQKVEKTSQGKLVLQVMNEVAGNVNFDINYLTDNASWAPFYDLRAESVKTPINMMYKAQVIQNTGIDWKNVALTLSSGNPNQNNQAPILNAWFLRYGYQNVYYAQDFMANQLQGKVAGLQVESESIRDERKDNGISDYTTITENQLNISFEIDIPYDILSNGKAHSVVLKEIKLPATYKYYAAPRIENEAFLLAEIGDYSQYNLLPGEANIIFEGMYVGKTMINPNQTVDTLNLSMGRDKKISVKREKVADKSGTKFLSSTKEQTFTFDITVRNNKKEEVFILLKDQYPLSTDKEIEIELLESSKAKVNSETGILTWELNLKPNETRKLRISYKVKYPKDKIIENL